MRAEKVCIIHSAENREGNLQSGTGRGTDGEGAVFSASPRRRMAREHKKIDHERNNNYQLLLNDVSKIEEERSR